MVAKIEWTHDLDLGIEVIDNQHKVIVDALNVLNEVGATGDMVAMNAALDELVQYSVFHFKFEEDLLEKSGYASTRMHKLVHEMFLNKFSALLGRAKAGENVTAEISTMLVKWLVTHIKVEDAKYVVPIKEVLARQAKSSGGLASFFKRLFSRA